MTKSDILHALDPLISRSYVIVASFTQKAEAGAYQIPAEEVAELKRAREALDQAFHALLRAAA